jgi:hypothetical protein
MQGGADGVRYYAECILCPCILHTVHIVTAEPKWRIHFFFTVLVSTPYCVLGNSVLDTRKCAWCSGLRPEYTPYWIRSTPEEGTEVRGPSGTHSTCTGYTPYGHYNWTPYSMDTILDMLGWVLKIYAPPYKPFFTVVCTVYTVLGVPLQYFLEARHCAAVTTSTIAAIPSPASEDLQ